VAEVSCGSENCLGVVHKPQREGVGQMWTPAERGRGRTLWMFTSYL